MSAVANNTTDAEILDAALEAYGAVSFEAYEAGSDFDHEMATRALLTAVEPLIRQRIAAEVEAEAYSYPTHDTEVGFNDAIEELARKIRESS